MDKWTGKLKPFKVVIEPLNVSEVMSLPRMFKEEASCLLINGHNKALAKLPKVILERLTFPTIPVHEKHGESVVVTAE